LGGAGVDGWRRRERKMMMGLQRIVRENLQEGGW
jgi:hypothetical protein